MVVLLNSSRKKLIILLFINLFFIEFSIAKPIQFEAVIVPKDDKTLAFEDASGHIVRLVQRVGKVSGDLPFAGTTMLEWGIHDLQVTDGTGMGYLIFTHAERKTIYLKFQWVATGIKDEEGNANFIIGGQWSFDDKTGEHSGLGTLRINILSPDERQWIFEGDISG